MARKQVISPPEEGSEAPEFNLPVAQGGQLRLGLRTARGPVIVIFYRGAWSGECVEYFKALAEMEREINVAGATLVGVGPAEPEEAREFVRESGFKSFVLYDYIRRTTSEYGLLQKDDPEHGHAARPAAFIVGKDQEVIRAWLDDRPAPEDLLAEVSKITGLPKEPDEGEAEEKPKRRPKKAAESETAEDESEASEKNSPEKGGASNSGEATSEAAEAAEAAEAGEAGDSGASQKEPVESAESTAEQADSADSTENAEERGKSPAASEGGERPDAEDATTAPEGETKSPENAENAGDTDTGDSSGSLESGESERGSTSLDEVLEPEPELGEGGSDASTGDQEDTSPETGESGGDGATSSREDR